MGASLAGLVGAALAFVGAHVLLSGPLRRGLVRALGERGFLLAYSLVALATFSAMILAFGCTPPGEPLWNGAALLPWLAACVLTIVALALFLASLAGNPALPQAVVAGLSARKPHGVFRITRHPMMMAFALWALAHILVAPTARTIVLCLAILILALAGSRLQDRRKRAQFPAEWKVWMARTRFWPQWRSLPALGGVWLAALVVWIGVTWAHLPMGDVPAGLWRWLG